jgi:heme/copper-type cytochrome/quinol oxidase subunit 2
MTQTAKGIAYDCKHIDEISKANDNESHVRSLGRVFTRQHRFPYVMLWVIILSVIFLVVVLLSILISVSRRIRNQHRHRYYFKHM